MKDSHRTCDKPFYMRAMEAINMLSVPAAEQASLINAAKGRKMVQLAADVRKELGEDSSAYRNAIAKGELRKSAAADILAESQRMRLVEEECALHGRVVEPSGRGVGGWIAILKDEKGVTIDRQETDKLGHFSFRPMKSGETSGGPLLGRARREKAAKSGKAGPSGAGEGGEGEFVIEVHDAEGRVREKFSVDRLSLPGELRYTELKILRRAKE